MDIQLTQQPEAGKDYPRNWNEFLDWFASEEACVAYLARLRWPQGFNCPQCSGSQTPYRSSRARIMCRDCRHQTTVTAGTIFDKTRTPLRVWFAAAWHITHQKHGASALGLQRVLGLNSYQTAWTMLHRLRRAMVRPDRELLHGQVEVDESYLDISDREESSLPARQRKKSRTNKVLVVIAVEILQPKGFGRIRLRRIPKDSAEYVIPFIQSTIQPGAVVRTDGSAAYRSLKALGYAHNRNVMLGSDTAAHVSMAGVHRVASLVKRWVMGTHHGAVHPEHLDTYLEEFVFRFNRRKSRSRGMLFFRLLEQAVITNPVTYRDVVKGQLTASDKGSECSEWS